MSCDRRRQSPMGPRARQLELSARATCRSRLPPKRARRSMAVAVAAAALQRQQLQHQRQRQRPLRYPRRLLHRPQALRAPLPPPWPRPLPMKALRRAVSKSCASAPTPLAMRNTLWWASTQRVKRRGGGCCDRSSRGQTRSMPIAKRRAPPPRPPPRPPPLLERPLRVAEGAVPAAAAPEAAAARALVAARADVVEPPALARAATA